MLMITAMIVKMFGLEDSCDGQMFSVVEMAIDLGT